jgi:hypothetical protein
MSAFRIDIYSAAGAKLNTITQISGVGITSRVNRLGELRFTAPQVVALDRGVGRGKVYKLYSAVDGYLGEFYHSTDSLNETGDVLSVTCHDQLVQLTRKTVGFNWKFNGETMPNTMGRIATRFGGGWAVATDHSGGDFYNIAYESSGESFFNLLEVMRRTQAGWFALGGDKQIKYGRWLDSRLSGTIAARLVNVANPASWVSGGDAMIDAISISEDSSTVVNRVIAVGRGLGAAQFNLNYSDMDSPYAISSRKNWDGANSDGTNSSGAYTSEYYIEDSASVTEYGLREATVNFDVTPAGTSRADMLNAGNALYTIASAYLLRSRKHLTNYTLSCVGLPKTVAPGDVIEVDYFGVATVVEGGVAVRKSTLRLNKTRLFVAEVAHEFDEAGGVRRSMLTVSNTGELLADANETVTELIRDAKRFRLVPQPSLTRFTEGGENATISPDLTYEMKLRFTRRVAEINQCRLNFHVTKLRSSSSSSTAASSTTTTGSGGSSTQSTTSASGGGTTLTSNSAGDSSTLDYSYETSLAFQTNLGFTYASIDAAMYVNNSSFSGNTGGIAYGTAGAQHGHYNAENSHNHRYEAHAHKYSLPAHAHSVVIPSHTHGVTINIPSHTHDFAHTHPIEWGVFEDTVSPAGVSVWLNGTQITPIKNLITGQIAGNDVDGEGWYYVDFTNALTTPGFEWHGTQSVEIRCAQGRGSVFAQTDEWLTVVPIAADE